jgi:uncharacterized protein YbbK (DUF523 family)
MDRILVSACLLGRPVRYDGSHKSSNDVLLERWHKQGRLISICPEVMAGFPTPRPPAEIEHGKSAELVHAGLAKIFEENGNDVTSQFLSGAQIALNVALENNCRFAILTDGSPSCGSTYVYDGTFGGGQIADIGVVTHLLRENSITVFPETAISELARLIKD